MVRVIDILAKGLREFKYGKVPTVYLPFTGFLYKYLERYISRIVGDAEGVYARLTKLLNEIVSDPEYSVTTTVRMCKTMENDCLRRFLITREALFSITRAIRRYGAIPNSISIIRRECSVRPCGTVLSTAKTYDALLLIYGVAYSPIKMRCQILLSTPFTHTFMNVLLNAIAPEKYIDALRDFIECVVTVYPEPIENAVQYCGEVLRRSRHIGVEDCNVDSVVDTLYRLIEQLLTY
jgi:hypothetical protein